MAPNDTLPEERDDVIAAARAAASWARARRATWTNAPLPALSAKARRRRGRAETLPAVEPPPAYNPPPPPPLVPPPPVVIPAPVVTPVPIVPPPSIVVPPLVPAPPIAPPPLFAPPVQRLPPPPPPAVTAPPRDSGPSMGARVAEGARAIGAPIVSWLPRLAAVIALGAVVVIGGPYVWDKIVNRPKPAVVDERPPPAPRPQAAQAPASKRRATGGLSVASTPPGARVIIDGKPRGLTPLTIPDLPAGKHEIELRSDAGTIQRTVTIAADQTAEIEESIFSGWLAVHSPFDVVISEGNRALALDDRNQVMLPPGRHQVRVVNKALAYDAAHQVDLKPGEVTHLTIAPAQSSLTLTASEPVTVWLDGERLGESPLTTVPVSVGTHELLVRRAAGGERRLTITVTTNPFALHIDFSRPSG